MAWGRARRRSRRSFVDVATTRRGARVFPRDSASAAAHGGATPESCGGRFPGLRLDNGGGRGLAREFSRLPRTRSDLDDARVRHAFTGEGREEESHRGHSRRRRTSRGRGRGVGRARGVDAPGARDMAEPASAAGGEHRRAQLLAQHVALVRESNPIRTRTGPRVLALVLAVAPALSSSGLVLVLVRPRLAWGRAAPPRVNFERRSPSPALPPPRPSTPRTRLDRTRRPDSTPSTRPTKISIARPNRALRFRSPPPRARAPRRGAAAAAAPAGVPVRSDGGAISRALRLDRVMSAVLGLATLGGAPAAAPVLLHVHVERDSTLLQRREYLGGHGRHECVRSWRAAAAAPPTVPPPLLLLLRRRESLEISPSPWTRGRRRRARASRARFPTPVRGDRGIAREVAVTAPVVGRAFAASLGRDRRASRRPCGAAPWRV